MLRAYVFCADGSAEGEETPSEQEGLVIRAAAFSSKSLDNSYSFYAKLFWAHAFRAIGPCLFRSVCYNSKDTNRSLFHTAPAVDSHGLSRPLCGIFRACGGQQVLLLSQHPLLPAGVRVHGPELLPG